ncbi:NAD(P)-dependent oxidoreductase [Patescibacteria group bacterium]|nr:NAD(P)-dependent oxidoreductase [Patescibacteria group bacterium]
MTINNRKYHIGIIGTGFIARGLLYALRHHARLEVSRVLTRRPIDTIKKLPIEKNLLIHNVEDIIRASDLVIECTGDAIHGAEIAEYILKAGIPMVTMNPELQLTAGSILSQMGTFIEAEGDQPGTIARLNLEMRDMGFEPIVYGNIKGFLNLNPTLEEMTYWSKRNGISLSQVTAFTDGSKVQIEQALVANGLGATIAQKGLSCIECKDYKDGADRLGEIADEFGEAISDYVLCPGAPAGVFIVAKHTKEQTSYLKYLKLGDGPNYTIIKPYHLCHLEIAKTIKNVLMGNMEYDFNNGSNPTVQVATVTKRKIMSGEYIERGLGSFDVRGEAVKICELPNAVPLTLIHKAGFVKTVEEGQVITFDNVELPQTRALKMWQETLRNINIEDNETEEITITKHENDKANHTNGQLEQNEFAPTRPFSFLKSFPLFKYLNNS